MIIGRQDNFALATLLAIKFLKKNEEKDILFLGDIELLHYTAVYSSIKNYKYYINANASNTFPKQGSCTLGTV